MSKEGSAAPKERVNIVYRAATGSAAEEVELPFKTLVLGDFTGQQSDTPLEERKPIQVDKDNFKEVMQQQRLHLNVQVQDTLSDDPDARLNVQLRVDSLKDLEPEGIAQQVEPLRSLIELRQALAALKGPMGNIPAFRKKIQHILSDPDSRARLLAELNLGSNETSSEQGD